jgi:hypothetical protein
MILHVMALMSSAIVLGLHCIFCFANESLSLYLYIYIFVAIFLHWFYVIIFLGYRLLVLCFYCFCAIITVVFGNICTPIFHSNGVFRSYWCCFRQCWIENCQEIYICHVGLLTDRYRSRINFFLFWSFYLLELQYAVSYCIGTVSITYACVLVIGIKIRSSCVGRNGKG